MKRDNLIIDVGMHTGEDTAFYLAKGFDVVAVEANPDLVALAERNFGDVIRAGRLKVFGVAIAEANGTLPLSVADGQTEWSSLSREFVDRNTTLAGTTYRTIDVPTVPFADILAEVGIPRYLKIDIEGLDMLCVTALHHFTERPDYISLESHVSVNTAEASAVFNELAHLWALGYRQFQYVDQLQHAKRSALLPSKEGFYADPSASHSGLFGEELSGEWRSMGVTLALSQVLRLQQNLGGMGGRWSHTYRAKVFRALRRVALRRRTGWYDLHARLGT